MKKIILILLVVTVFSCKNDKSKKQELNKNNVEKKSVVIDVEIPDYKTWSKVEVKLSESLIMYANKKANLLSRKLGESKSYYATTKKVMVDDENDYIASIIVKEGEFSSFFALRIMGVYPNRVDAVFDLKNGTVKGVMKSKNFDNESAKIEDLGNGWYKCSVSAKVSADYVRILLGPTIKNKKVSSWEGKTNTICDVYILPSSLKLEKILD